MAAISEGRRKRGRRRPAPPVHLESTSGNGQYQMALTNQNSITNVTYGPVHTINNHNPVTNIVYANESVRFIANVSANFTLSSIQDVDRRRILAILKLRHVPQAVYGAQIEKGCMEGTRVQILCDIDAWVKDLTGPQIFWLAGMAGTGKTAIACTACSRANDDQGIILGGSFFCSRSTGLESQRDVRCVVPTLAQLLARQETSFAEALAVELERDPDVLHQRIGLQIEKLLYKPLLALKHSQRPILFVIDALDECGGQLSATEALNDAETHKIVSDMLEALVSFSPSGFKLPVKFLVTSRPETHIRDTPVSDVKFSKVLRLHTVKKEQVTADIKLYITHRLLVPSRMSGLFSKADVRRLARFCDGLFIVAATALHHAIGAGVEVARARFNSLFSASAEHLSDESTAPLDRMYAMILEDAAKTDDIVADKLKHLLRVLAALLSTRITLSVAALADLLDLPNSQLRAKLTRLHAVIHVPDGDDEPNLRPIHASFGEYLFRRAPSHIRLSESLSHEVLAHGCLDIMVKRLRFNVSHSQSSCNRNKTTRPKGITLSLEYACLQWIYHASSVPKPSQPDSSFTSIIGSWLLSFIYRESHQPRGLGLDNKIDEIFRPRLLFWLEVMSVLGQVQRAAAMLNFAATVVQSKELSQFLRDANTFVASSQDAIEQSAPHIYISALPFAEKTSLVYHEFSPLCTGLITVNVSELSHHAGRLVMTLRGHTQCVNAVSYSQTGQFLASASDDGTARIWDNRTGEEMVNPLRCGNSAVWSISFSPDGSSVVLGTAAGFVCIWTFLDTRVAPRRLKGHTAGVLSVLFSPSGSLIASASLDKTVRLWSTNWSANSSQSPTILGDQMPKVKALAFSPDSLTLASGSENGLVHIWDVSTRQLTYQSPHRYQHRIYSMCFLPGGQKLVVGTERDVILCEPKTGKVTATLYTGSEPVLSVCPSPDGQSLASAHGKTVCLSTLPRFIAMSSTTILDGHTKRVRATTVSPDGLYCASASDDGTIRIWHVMDKSDEVKPQVDFDSPSYGAAAFDGIPDSRMLSGHDAQVNSIAVSLDGSTIVSGSADHSVCIWDARTGAAMLPSLVGHKGDILSVAISPDARVIASASRDRTVRLWSTQTGDLFGDAIKAHTDVVRDVTFSFDGRWLASASDDRTVRIWDLTGQNLSTVRTLICGHGVRTVAFSPHGLMLAAGDEIGRIHLWEPTTGTAIRKPMRTNVETVYCLQFSPNGTRIAFGGRDRSTREGRVQIWNVEKGEQACVLKGHANSVLSVAYSSDGSYVVTGSSDESIRIWDAGTGVVLATLNGHGDGVESVIFTHDRQFIVSASHDKTIRVWDVERAIKPRQIRTSGPESIICSATLNNGWLEGGTGNLLLWLPPKYRCYFAAPPCTLVIPPGRVAFTASGGVWQRGKAWALCWSADTHEPTSPAM